MSWFTFGNDSGIDSRSARAIFTSLFLVLNLLIAFIGGRLIKRQSQRLFLHNKPVPVTRMTPFLSLGSVGSYILTLRTIPGRWYGVLMIVNAVFGIVNHYIVNIYVIQTTQNYICTFDTGILTTHANNQLTPVPVWATAHLAFSAQDSVATNGGVPGIYTMIPNDGLALFRPTERDVLGYWNCTQMPDSTIEPADWVSLAAIQAFTARQGFLYDNGTTTGWHTKWDGAILPANNDSYISLMAWSADLGPDDPGLFDVRATIAIPANLSVDNTASNFQCSLQKTVANWTPATIRSDDALDDWADTVLGAVQDLAPAQFGAELENVLNIMWMISGSGNTHFHTLNEADLTGTAATFQERTTYGCVRQVTSIGPEVFVIALVLIIFFLVLLGIDLTTLVYNHFDKNKKKANRLPFDLLEWQAGLVGRMTGNNAIKAKELWEYEFYMDESLEHYRCRKIHKNLTTVEPLLGTHPGSPNSGPKTDIEVGVVEK